MNSRRNIRTVLMLFCALFILLGVYLIYIVNAYGTRWFTSPYNTRIQSQKDAIIAGDILDCNGEILATTDADGNRVYSSDETLRLATSHVVGDNYSQTYGAETFFARYLLGFDQSMLDRLSLAISGKPQTGSDIRLSIDSKLCKYAYEQLTGYNGAVVVMDYKTGKLLCLACSPAFDPANVSQYLSGDIQFPEDAMFNRATMGRYTPGSTFKLVTLTAALRNLPDVENRQFECNGPLVYEANSRRLLENVYVEPDTPTITDKYLLLKDFENEYHASLSLKDAFQASCNVTFASLATELGALKLQSCANSLGFNKEFLFSDMVVYQSSFEKASNDYDLAWGGVGQYTDQVTPLHMCMISAAIANNGVMMEPKLLSSVISADGTSEQIQETSEYSSPFKQAEAEILREYMFAVVEGGTGTKAKIEGFKVGGKTGSAETSQNKSIATHAWFTGFIYDDAHPLAICVIFEHAGSGGSISAPAAAKILKKAIELGH